MSLDLPESSIPEWASIHTLIFDFDGVFTDNNVWVDQQGNETVRCDRRDGLAFDLLRSFILKNNWYVKYFILSKEKNPVVSARALKLKIPCYNDISNKINFVRDHLKNRFPHVEDSSKGVIYIGNDLNDLAAMSFAGYSVSPSDAHPIVQQYASLVMHEKGGEGFVRAFVEKLLRIDKLDIRELAKLF